jgi:hypothetical protein
MYKKPRNSFKPFPFLNIQVHGASRCVIFREVCCYALGMVPHLKAFNVSFWKETPPSGSQAVTKVRSIISRDLHLLSTTLHLY